MAMNSKIRLQTDEMKMKREKKKKCKEEFSEEIRENFFGLAVKFSECELDFNTFSLQHHHISIFFSFYFCPTTFLFSLV